MRLTIAIDIDGTIRNLEKQVKDYLEIDHPEKIEEFKKNSGVIYRTLDSVFPNENDLYQWMYEERVFDLFGRAEKLHPKVIDDLNFFSVAAKSAGFDVVIASVQRNQSITATMHWLSRNGCKVQRYAFFHTMKEKIDAGFDFYIDDCPEVLNAVVGKTKVPTSHDSMVGVSRAIKIPYEFTKDINCPSLDIANGKFDDLYDIMGIEKILKK